MPIALLEGGIVEPAADEVTRLRREIAGLEGELREAQERAEEYKRASSEAIQAIRALRKQLEPLYNAMRMVFGEISRVEADSVPDPTYAQGPPSSAKWDSWKSRLGGKASEFIDLLLINGKMTITQLAAAGHCHYDTAKRTVSKMKDVGIAVNGSDGVSLK